MGFSGEQIVEDIRKKVELFLDAYQGFLTPSVISKMRTWRSTPHSFLFKDAQETLEALRWSGDVHHEFLYDFSFMHPEVRSECEALFNDHHFDSAILEAYKVVIEKIKKKTKIERDGGKGLMSEVFSPTNAVLKLNKLESTSDKNEQEGFMHLFIGAVVGIRNPKAHDLIHQNDPIRTLEYLAFASLLARKVDEATSREA